MAEIIMPKVGDAMTEGKIVRWYKKPGDGVAKGEPVLEIETDKVNLDLEAESDGTLGGDVVAEGTMVLVGETVGRILAPGEKAAPKMKTVPKGEPPSGDAVLPLPAAGGEAGTTVPAVAAESRTAAPQGGDRRRSSPLARRIAREIGVSLESVRGSGPQGRIVAKDVEGLRDTTAAASTPPGQPGLSAALPQLEARSVPLTAMRRTIARRLSESTGPIPTFFLTVDCDVTALVSLRQQLADIEGTKISLNDLIVKAAALALRHHPMVNSSWGDEAIALHGEVHVGIAVSTPEGLITPVIRNADRKSVPEIAQEVRALADKAKSRKLLPNEYQGSTITISNLGAWGIEEFTAIINPPNTAILAIGAAEARPVVVDRRVVVRDRMKVTMSCDHRVVDGTAGAEFLKTLRQYLEQPLRLVV